MKLYIVKLSFFSERALIDSSNLIDWGWPKFVILYPRTLFLIKLKVTEEGQTHNTSAYQHLYFVIEGAKIIIQSDEFVTKCFR